MVVTAVVVAAVVGDVVYGWDVDGFFFDGRWLVFALGIQLYHARNYGSPRATLLATLTALVVVTALLLGRMEQLLASPPTGSRSYSWVRSPP